MARIGLVHGLGGTAATMGPLASLLAAGGHDVVAVTLPGHGTEPADLVGVTWADWLAAVPPAEVLVGQSMGGALALAAAAADESVRAVVAVNTPAPDPDAVDGLEWRQSRGHDWVDGPELAPGEVGYTRLPIGALLAMAHGVLSVPLDRVAARVLLANGAHDDVVDPASADVLAAGLPGPVTRLVLPNSSHVASLGPDLPLLATSILEFL